MIIASRAHEESSALGDLTNSFLNICRRRLVEDLKAVEALRLEPIERLLQSFEAAQRRDGVGDKDQSPGIVNEFNRLGRVRWPRGAPGFVGGSERLPENGVLRIHAVGQEMQRPDRRRRVQFQTG